MAVLNQVRTTLEWTGGLAFRGAAGERGLQIDGERGAACSPTETLTLALGACMAIDVVVILQKRRATLTSVRGELEGERAAEEPRRFTRIALRFALSGNGFEEAHVERAIALSREKYCSVWHSLRQDIELVTTFRLEASS
jgi:putative redox protein